MNFTRIGPLEIFLILLVVLIIFGVGKLPSAGRGMGQAIREFRSSVKDGEKAKDEDDAKSDAKTDSTPV